MTTPLKWAVGDRCRWGNTVFRIRKILPKGTRLHGGEVLSFALAEIVPIEPDHVTVRTSDLELALEPSSDSPGEKR